MKLKKIIFTGFLGFNLSFAISASLFNNMTYAKSTEVVYKAFAEKMDFSDR